MQLRALEIADLPFLYQWENDAEAWGDGATHNPLSRDVLRSYVEQQTGDIYRDGQLRLVLVGDAGETMGCMDLFDLDARSRRAAVGMYIAPEYRGGGVGQEAVRLLEEYAFQFLGLHQLYAIIAVDNPAATAIYEKAGYVASGRLQDWVFRAGQYADAVVWQKIKHEHYEY